jgi:hypothetical protein
MKDFLKALGVAITLGATIYRAIKKAKDKHEKEDIYKAIADRDLNKLRELIFK